MEIKDFWKLIEQSKELEDEIDQAEWTKDQLAKKSIEEIVQYEIIFTHFMNQSYTSALWGAAYVIMGGCSDDCFDYFRGWLIAQGEDVYNKTLANPEYLAAYIPPYYAEEDLAPQLEEMLSVAADAYTYRKTGTFEYNEDIYDEFLNLIEAKGSVIQNIEIEFDWEEEDLEERYPALWARFGEEPLL